MIGEIRKIIAPFYNSASGKMEYKSRPGLIIAQADVDDFTVLPVSRITKNQYIHAKYDIQIDPADYPELHLKSISYVRTHKITTVHQAEIGDLIGDLKGNYEELYLNVLVLQEEFSHSITEQALS